MMFTREFLSTMLTRVPLDDSAIYCLPVTKVMSAMIRYYTVSTGVFIQAQINIKCDVFFCYVSSDLILSYSHLPRLDCFSFTLWV